MRVPVAPTSVVLLVIVLAFLAACQRSQLATGVSDSTFVTVMAELKRVHDAPGVDSSHRAARRDSILQRRGLTSAQLEAAAKRLAENPTRAQTVWQAVERRANDTAKIK